MELNVERTKAKARASVNLETRSGSKREGVAGKQEEKPFRADPPPRQLQELEYAKAIQEARRLADVRRELALSQAASPPPPPEGRARNKKRRPRSASEQFIPLIGEVTGVAPSPPLKPAKPSAGSGARGAAGRARGPSGAAAAVAAPSNIEWAHAAGVESVALLGERLRKGREAREALVAMNGGLVTSICRKYKPALDEARGVVTMADLKQEATIGLIRAAEKFDPSLGCRFSTYATTWIRAAALEALGRNSAIDLPRELRYQYKKMLQMQRVASGDEEELGFSQQTLVDDAEASAPASTTTKEIVQQQQEQQRAEWNAAAATVDAADAQVGQAAEEASPSPRRQGNAKKQAPPPRQGNGGKRKTAAAVGSAALSSQGHKRLLRPKGQALSADLDPSSHVGTPSALSSPPSFLPVGAEDGGNNRELSEQELARALGVTVKRVRDVKAAASVHVVSYDALGGGGGSSSSSGSGGASGGGVSLMEGAVGSAAWEDRGAHQERASRELKTDLELLLSSSCDDVEQLVVRLRFGLDDRQVRSIAECAKLLGLNRNTIRTKTESAFRKMRAAEGANELLAVFYE